MTLLKVESGAARTTFGLEHLIVVLLVIVFVVIQVYELQAALQIFFSCFSSTVILIVFLMVVMSRYTSAKLHIKGVIGIEIEGPGGELYVKLKQGTMLPDCDFETGSCGWNDAVELNSTEFFRFTRTKGWKQ